MAAWTVSDTSSELSRLLLAVLSAFESRVFSVAPVPAVSSAVISSCIVAKMSCDELASTVNVSPSAGAPVIDHSTP